MAETIGRRAGLLVLAAGIVATLLLQLVVPSVEVFWSGDGGLKNLQAKQFAGGAPHVDLQGHQVQRSRAADGRLRLQEVSGGIAAMRVARCAWRMARPSGRSDGR